MKEVFIISAARTAIGSFNGTLASVPAPRLGAVAIKGVIKRAGIKVEDIDEVFMGNVLQAGIGQAPAKQAAIYAGIPEDVPCTTINKVCASGMKAVILGAQSILTGDNEVVIAGGMENMTSVPYYLTKARTGYRLGNGSLVDGLVNDGLMDVYNNCHMGNCAELCARDMNITREEQDNFAISSYKRASEAWEKCLFTDEILPVEIPQKKGDPILFNVDEEFSKVKIDKIPSLRPAFDKEGTVTAANASTLNDGAAAVILMSKEKALSLGLKPIARLLSYADAANKPEWFTTAPAKALPKAIDKAGLTINDIDLFELNEAFSVVSLANIKLMKLDPSKVNVNGGAVALGHPLGCSGTRIIVTLIHALGQHNAKYGAAGICNGGGGASAVIIEKL